MVRFGVVGTNFITDWMLEGARRDSRFRLAAVCSRSRERGEALIKRHGLEGVEVFTSLEAMVGSDSVDAVYLATPNSLHASQGILCMSHGKHLLCEKPLASNAAEASAMVEASHRYGVALMEAMKSTLTPAFRAVANNLWRLGRIRRYVASYCQYSSRYDRYKSGESLPNAFNPAMSNGALMDIGVYTIWPLVALFGAPERVAACGTVLPSGTDGQGSALLSYADMEATVVWSKISDSSLPAEIQGEDGTISIDRINAPERVVLAPRVAKTGGRGAAFEAEVLSCRTEGEPEFSDYGREMSEFIDVIESGRLESDVNSHGVSLAVMRTLDAIRAAMGVNFPADFIK